jgi:hypothetical protein
MKAHEAKALVADFKKHGRILHVVYNPLYAERYGEEEAWDAVSEYDPLYIMPEQARLEFRPDCGVVE